MADLTGEPVGGHDEDESQTTQRDPRRANTYLTLTAGFASTLSFPLCYWLIAQVGWREALLWLALINAAVCLPLHWFVLRTAPNSEVPRVFARPMKRAMISMP